MARRAEAQTREDGDWRKRAPLWDSTRVVQPGWPLSLLACHHARLLLSAHVLSLDLGTAAAQPAPNGTSPPLPAHSPQNVALHLRSSHFT